MIEEILPVGPENSPLAKSQRNREPHWLHCLSALPAFSSTAPPAYVPRTRGHTPFMFAPCGPALGTAAPQRAEEGTISLATASTGTPDHADGISRSRPRSHRRISRPIQASFFRNSSAKSCR